MFNVNKGLIDLVGIDLRDLMKYAYELPVINQLGDEAREIQDLFMEYQNYNYDPILGDTQNITTEERDALQHFYGAQATADKHGSLVAHLAGMYHELEGASEGHSKDSIIADLINNVVGINQEGTPIPTIGDYDLVELLTKYKDNTISENERQILDTYVDYGLAATVEPPWSAYGTYEEGKPGIWEQLFGE